MGKNRFNQSETSPGLQNRQNTILPNIPFVMVYRFFEFCDFWAYRPGAPLNINKCIYLYKLMTNNEWL